MVGDNDAGGVATYAQAGQNYGTSLLWVLLLLIPVLIVNQEMVVRLGAVTGVGHARLIIERFGRFWGWFSVGDLFLLNFLTIVTEFIGVSLALGYFGVRDTSPSRRRARADRDHRHRQLPPLGALDVRLHGRQLAGDPAGVHVASALGPIARDTFVPGIAGGLDSTAVLLIIAIVGTTVAPWQLFFQQSNIIDKRITPRWINYERADTVIGAVRRRARRRRADDDRRFAFGGTHRPGISPTPAPSRAGSSHTLGRRRALSRSCCSTPR